LVHSLSSWAASNGYQTSDQRPTHPRLHGRDVSWTVPATRSWGHPARVGGIGTGWSRRWTSSGHPRLRGRDVSWTVPATRSWGHPRPCGRDWDGVEQAVDEFGSSAPVWARQSSGYFATRVMRFIRAPVGTPIWHSMRSGGSVVHPRPLGRAAVRTLLIHMLKEHPITSANGLAWSSSPTITLISAAVPMRSA
jgi:hypothetical protein